MERRRTLLWCLLALLILLCGFVDSSGRAWMAGYERAGGPQVHVKPILALPGISATFAGVANIWPFSSTNVWVEGSNQTPGMDEQFQQVTQHFDGSKWTFYLPTGIKYDPIVSTSPTNTWALGGSTTGGHGYEVNTVSLDHFPSGLATRPGTGTQFNLQAVSAWEHLVHL